MAILTQEMMDMIATQQCFIGTVDEDGNPNVAPKRSTRVLSEDSLNIYGRYRRCYLCQY